VKKLSPLVIVALAAAFVATTALAGMVGQKLPSSSLNFVGTKPDMEGKPLLLEFWDTWCPPCRKSIPHLNGIHAKFKDRGLLVVGVSDEPNAVIKKFQKEVPMDYAVATDTGGRLIEKMGVSSIPTAFLINKSGEIVWEGHPNRLRDEDIDKILQ
jgi:peroxiredoxin